MKTTMLLLCISFSLSQIAYSQSPETADHVIEGSKVFVELVKALSGKKDNGKDPGCKNNYADLCIENTADTSLTVILKNRASGEKREVVILPKGKECSLQLTEAVWNYDLRLTGTEQALRKGDMRIKGCDNMNMKIK